ncbi:hypothetical protein QLX08_007831 [Tetragonisca angustula]|uniref:Uncharacterized protein n=1 Tax=Tetragonisca angustula TaxID=166442 RepID=A0AAW0ZN26_9HYME
MRYYLCLLIVAVCGAARIPRVTEQPYFPLFRNIYANHNYQTDPVSNHVGEPFFENYRILDGNIGAGNEFYDHRTSIDGRANFDDHLTGVPFEDFRGHNAGAVPQHYERFNHAPNYDYPL